MSNTPIIDRHGAAPASTSSDATADELHPPFRRFIPSRSRLFSVEESNADHSWRAVIVKMRPVRKLLNQPGSRGLALHSVSGFPTAGHWALEVGDFTYELLVGDDGEPELFFGEWLPPPPNVELGSIKRIKVGNCNMSDEEIYGLASEVFDRMQISGEGYSQLSNNCQRYVRHLSSKLCARSVTDWLATNFMFVTRAIPSSTLIKQSTWIALRGASSWGMMIGLVVVADEVEAWLDSLSVPSLVAHGLLMAICVAVGDLWEKTLGVLAYVPFIMISNFQRAIGRKIEWTSQVTPQDYMQVYGSRNIHLEATDAVIAMTLHGNKGRSFARQWFNMARPDGLGVYRSLLDIVSGRQASNTHEFIDWMKKIPQIAIKNEKHALATVAKRVESTIEARVTTENGIKVLNRGKEILRKEVTIKNAKKAFKLAKSMGDHVLAHQRSSQTAHPKMVAVDDLSRKPTPRSVSFSNTRVEEDDKGYESALPQQDDTRGLQAVIVRSKDIEGNLGVSGDEEDEELREVIHVGDLDLLDEWFRLQIEDQIDLVQ